MPGGPMSRCVMTLLMVLLSSLIGAVASVDGAAATTVVTDYSYNLDGALTAVSVQTNGGAAETTYLTWDNFTPDGTMPTKGAVSMGDGRLSGFGASPGTSGMTSRFQFDLRDRLLGYSSAAGVDETYDYHAGGMMKSSSVDDDELSFYYDAGVSPVATNIHQMSAGLTSAYLGNVRYLDDGGEQVLLKPRKDVACSYDSETESVSSYVYDAFGTDRDEPVDTYDLHDNPFRYTGEYRTPIWGGYFLRARWYHPDLPSFISRDPEPKLNRFGYGAANPAMFTDPTGRSAKFFGGVQSFLRRLDTKLNSGVGGHFARLFLAPLLGPLQIAAYPKQFWQAVKTDRDGTDVFLALGIASEVAGGFADSYFAGYGVSLARRFLYRAASDLAIGVSASIAAGADRGFNHFNWQTFGQGLELTAGSLLYRGLNGTNVASSFQLSSEDVVNLAGKELENAPKDTAVIFRQRTAFDRSQFAQNATELHSPIREALNLGFYHERLIAVTKDEILMSDLIDEGIRISATEFTDFNAISKELTSYKGKFEFVGSIDLSADSNRAKFLGNPRNLPVSVNESGLENHELRRLTNKRNEYGPFRNNCQSHALSVLKDLGLR